MYQLSRLFDGQWNEFDKTFKMESRRRAIAWIRARYNYKEGTFKVRKVS